MLFVLGALYGAGFSLTFVGQSCLLTLTSKQPSLGTFVFKTIAWPLTWGRFGYTLWKNDQGFSGR